jgi:hypothetical protein
MRQRGGTVVEPCRRWLSDGVADGAGYLAIAMITAGTASLVMVVNALCGGQATGSPGKDGASAAAPGVVGRDRGSGR